MRVHDARPVRQRRPKGMVFVSYAHVDRKRVEPLVNLLAARFNVWWDKEIELGPSYRSTLMKKLDTARCVVVVWTTASVERDFVWSEVDRVKEFGIVVPVKLDANARIPLGFDQMQHLDLTSWTGRGTKELQELFARIKALLAKPRMQRDASTLSSAPYALDRSVAAAARLQQLSEDIRTIGGILMPGRGPVEDLLGTLEEVHRTYASVSAAISRFVAPAVRRGAIDPKPYLAMERGELTTLIENNRGHCTRIVEYYARVGGLRDSLEQRLAPDKLELLDETFGQLGTGDIDLFDALASVGAVLTGEASVIAGLALSGQQAAARERILDGRKKLLPLESCLSKAMTDLQRIESSLGFVPRTGKHKPTRGRRPAH
jgi:TIR domain